MYEKSIEAVARRYKNVKCIVPGETYASIDHIRMEYLKRHTPQDVDLFDWELKEFMEPYLKIPACVYRLYRRYGMD